jgi:hypothetical protein
MFAHKYDINGAWIPGGEIRLKDGEEIPEGYTTTPLPQPNWKPVYKNGAWVETATESEKNPPQPPVQPTVEEQLSKKDEEIRELKSLMLQMDENLSAFMDYQLSKEVNGGI